MTPAAAPQPDSPTWTITYQREDTRPSPAGGFQTGVTVGFTTSHGVTQSIFFPYAQYTPENVKRAIDGQVALIDQVHKLAG